MYPCDGHKKRVVEGVLDGQRVSEARKACFQPQTGEIVYFDVDDGAQLLRGQLLFGNRG